MESSRTAAADVQITGVLDMRNHEVRGLETDLSLYPVRDDQGTSKVYVDSVRDQIIASLPLGADNGVF